MDYIKLAELLFPDVTGTPDDMETRYPVRELPEGAIVSRAAPSPTGFVHLGNLLQGITSERLAHQTGGVHYFRVEDTDAKREVPGAVWVLIESLLHYNVVFDEGAFIDGDHGVYGPYKQRQRKQIYHIYAKKMVLEGKAYPCFCTAEELTDIRARQEAEKANFGYFGKWAVWRDRNIDEIEQMLKTGTPWVLRFRSTGSIINKFKITDLIKGDLELTENDIDHVLLKSDGIPTYHFAHAVDDHLMRTTHVVRGDEWLPSLPFHVQLFNVLGFKLPKYLHIGTLMKMDGTSKRKLSKRKDPELALSYYKAQGFPVESVYEYVLTVLNSNYEDWRRANPDASPLDFKFSYKKMNAAGSLFDVMKLRDISKDVISRMSADMVYEKTLDWAGEFDVPFADCLKRDPAYSKAAFSIGRGGKKPRKDFAIWSEVRGYIGFIFDDFFEIESEYPENFDKQTIINALSTFNKSYDSGDDQTVWFDKIKIIADALGFASDMKVYKQNPDAYPGNVADISMFLRVAVTGKMNSPDMYEVMRLLGSGRVSQRINAMINRLSNE